MLGGWAKRTIDLFVTVLTVPVWLPLMLGAALWARLRFGGPVFLAHDRVGYGGRHFRCLSLRIAPRAAKVERVRVGEDSPLDLTLIANDAASAPSKWSMFLERLPQLLHVIAGDMAIVGPRPLSRDELEPLKTARRYYLSARPGVIGVGSIAEGGELTSAPKYYAMMWAISVDLGIVWNALTSTPRDELWRPEAHTSTVTSIAPEALQRRRRSAD
jgi:exopolysaccharide production protein ExoY